MPIVLSMLAAPAGTADEPPDVAAARREAEGTHATVHALLHAVHDRYYREDEGLPLPAAVFRTVFDELARERGVTLRWLAVDGVAMNEDHRPRDAFERDAARLLAEGRMAVEEVEGGLYRRAGAVVLTNQCLKCHVPDRRNLENRTAGLVISLPLARIPPTTPPGSSRLGD